MNRRFALSILLIILTTMCPVAVKPANFASANFQPQPTPPPSVVINSDGTVEGANIHVVGNVYSLTGNVYGTIVVLRDGVVIDGAGYILQGNGEYTGIFLQDRSGVTITDMDIRGFEYGIMFTPSYGSPTARASSTISGNTITGNTYGIYINVGSASYVISNNHLASNTYGISIAASGSLFRNNTFENNHYSILDNTNGTNDMDTSNTVNGKTVYYWVNQHDKYVPSNAGFIVLKDCRNITVQKMKLEGNGNGILLYNTTDSSISENVFTNNLEGMTLKESSNNVLSGNNITSNQGNGISISNSNNTVILQNEVTDNDKDGVDVEVSTNNTINENYIMNNQGSGIGFSVTQDSNIIGNNLTLNHGYGVRFEFGSNGNRVEENYFLKNQESLLIKKSFENTITSNIISESNAWAIDIQLDSQNNTIYHNNFINNKLSDGLEVYIAGFWTFPSAPNYYNPDKPPKFIPGAFNAWDDGKEGNYWSDYTSRFSTVFAMNALGIGNPQFFINENNIDHYPSMTPFNISTAAVPQPKAVPSTLNSPSLSSPPSSSPTPIPSPPPSSTPSQQPASSPQLQSATLPEELVYAAVVGAAAMVVVAAVAVALRKRKQSNPSSTRASVYE